jgi:LAGLIDADG endonuclease
MNGDGGFSLLFLRGEAKYSLVVFISQNNRSLIVLNAIRDFLGYGEVYGAPKNCSIFRISSLEAINKFISYFKDVQFIGEKALNYNDFCKAV